MNSKRIIRTGIVIALAAVSAVSCVTNRKVAYLQDMQHETQIALEDKFEAVIAPYDELDVIITSFDSELARPFNLRNTNNANYSMSTGIAYLVDVYGNIELPVLGKLHAAGLTRLKLQESIKDLLISGGYISDPFVLVRFRNFKVFFLGANGGKAVSISNERCTFLEALALSGDMSVYTNRDKIMVVREVDGKMVVVAALDVHLKDPLGKLRKQGLFQALEGVAASGLLSEIAALVDAAAMDGVGGVFLRLEAVLFRLVGEQIHPKRPMLQLLPDGDDQGIFDPGFVFDLAHG